MWYDSREYGILPAELDCSTTLMSLNATKSLAFYSTALQGRIKVGQNRNADLIKGDCKQMAQATQQINRYYATEHSRSDTWTPTSRTGLPLSALPLSQQV
jgi:hypothetical protein